MQPHDRGHVSHTYDVRAIVVDDEDDLTLRVELASQVEPLTIQFDNTGNPIDRQLYRGFRDSLAIAGKGGRWESGYYLENMARIVRSLHHLALAEGITDLAVAEVQSSTLRELIKQFNQSQKRTLTHLLARIITAEGHPSYSAVARQLRNTKFVADDHTSSETYTDEQLGHIEDVTRTIIADAVVAQRGILDTLGYQTSNDAWMDVAPETVVADARTRDARRNEQGGKPLQGAPLPRSSAPIIDQIDWCLLNPRHRFGMRNPKRGRRQTHIRDVMEAIYPWADVILAGLALHCIADNTGVNHSVLLRTEVDEIQPLGPHSAIIQTAKARNHTADRRAVKHTGMFSAGGIQTTMTALMRFNTHQRAIDFADAGAPDDHPLLRRIYVVDHETTSKTATPNTAQLARRGRLMARIRDGYPGDPGATVRFRALRTAALRRGIVHDPQHDVADHSPRTRIEYLKQALHDVDLHKHVVAAQHSIHETSIDRFTDPESTARLLKAAEEDRLIDIGPTACTNNGRLPEAQATATEVESWCTQGLVACFTCPHGYRTLDMADDLLALRDYLELVRDDQPTEWRDGDGAVLHRMVTDTLDKFPKSVLRRAEQQLTGHHREMLLMDAHLLYTEERRA